MKDFTLKKKKNYEDRILLCDDHSTNINACEVWGVRVRFQVSRGEVHTHIHLDYARVKILSSIYIYIYKIMIKKNSLKVISNIYL